MSTDYAEKERDFIAALHEDTGRDLAGWMTAISASGLCERNAIIDWLRHQGFQFAKASWLERIHHNGGRLIYAETGGGGPRPFAFADQPPSDEPPMSNRPPSLPAPGVGPPPLDGSIQTLLASAKGLRPLAEHILSEVAGVVPGVAFTSENSFVVMSAPAPFAALAAGPKKLRLYANFGPEGARRSKAAEPVNKAKPQFAQMLLLDDARLIDEEFRQLIRAAATH